ncbi:hypothetical protein [Viridibacillus sp. FSL H8-0123]|uniref:hypothetical protein n=1 Tax=Viridibacillus sp. FSL H8-0123 TaxID=1928922 RepID=UPI00096DCCB6|nr:hypothetical protein [Viridibacillus sp. FSL H8-0123]OMC83339.1 hypothetical protein BK130_07260 [Viridibacillus sp. FSL H8-0123]
MDLNLIVNNTLSDLNKEGYVEKIVKAQLEKTLKNIVEDSFRSYGDFGKTLKEEIKNQMDINLKQLDIPSYNQVILNTIKAELERSVHEEGAQKIQEQIQELLGTSKEDYKLSELIKEMVEDEVELNELDYESIKEITVIVEKKFSSSTYVYLDPESDVDWYRCKYKITLDEDGTVSRAEVGETSFDNKVIMGGMYGLNATLFKIWTRGSKLIIDNYETEFSNPEYD